MKKFPRLIELLRETMNLTLGEAEALTRGVEAEAVSRCGGRNKLFAELSLFDKIWRFLDSCVDIRPPLIRRYMRSIEATPVDDVC